MAPGRIRRPPDSLAWRSQLSWRCIAHSYRGWGCGPLMFWGVGEVATNVTQRQESLRRRLRQARARLQTDLRFAVEASSDWGQTARNEPEREENGALSYERDTSLAVASQVRGELADIEAALARLDAGTFGICERCRRPIEAERLQAIPEALYCLPCARDLALFLRVGRRR